MKEQRAMEPYTYVDVCGPGQCTWKSDVEGYMTILHDLTHDHIEKTPSAPHLNSATRVKLFGLGRTISPIDGSGFCLKFSPCRTVLGSQSLVLFAR